MSVCETELEVATIAFNVPWAIEAQIRLIGKYLTDDHTLSVYDNSTDMVAGYQIKLLCADQGIRYVGVPSIHRGRDSHGRGLRHACEDLMNRQAPVIAFLDHDIFPTEPTSLLDLVKPCGFFGVGQFHDASGSTYLWPGFCAFDRAWLNGRHPDFGFIKGDLPGLNGDTGSLLADLVTAEEVAELPFIDYRYLEVTAPPIAPIARP